MHFRSIASASSYSDLSLWIWKIVRIRSKNICRNIGTYVNSHAELNERCTSRDNTRDARRGIIWYLDICSSKLSYLPTLFVNIHASCWHRWKASRGRHSTSAAGLIRVSRKHLNLFLLDVSNMTCLHLRNLNKLISSGNFCLNKLNFVNWR